MIDYTGGLSEAVLGYAAKRNFSYHRIYDIRLALTLEHHGITEFATRNVKHFAGTPLKKVFNPID